MCQRQFDKSQMRIRRRRDIDDVGIYGVQHLTRIGEERSPVRWRPVAIPIRNAGKFRVCHALPCIMVKLSKIPSTDNRHLK